MPFVLTISEKNHSWAGRAPVSTTHTTREEAEAELVRYVRANWDAEVGANDPAPDDPAEMVQEYFADVLESYDIKEHAA